MVVHPVINVAELSLAHAALSTHLGTLVLFGTVGVLEVDRLQVILEGVTPGKDSGVVATVVVAFAIVFKRALKLTFIRPDLLPVAFDVAEQVVRTRKPSQTVFANVRAQGRFKVGQFMGGQIAKVQLALRALALFTGLPQLLGKRGQPVDQQRQHQRLVFTVARQGRVYWGHRHNLRHQRRPHGWRQMRQHSDRLLLCLGYWQRRQVVGRQLNRVLERQQRRNRGERRQCRLMVWLVVVGEVQQRMDGWQLNAALLWSSVQHGYDLENKIPIWRYGSIYITVRLCYRNRGFRARRSEQHELFHRPGCLKKVGNRREAWHPRGATGRPK